MYSIYAHMVYVFHSLYSMSDRALKVASNSMVYNAVGQAKCWYANCVSGPCIYNIGMYGFNIFYNHSWPHCTIDLRYIIKLSRSVQ